MSALPKPDIPERILDTALELFSSAGYFNTSVHDICRAADVSIGSVYHHFGSKEGVVRALHDAILQQMGDAIAEVCRLDVPVRQRCREVVALLFEACERDPLVMSFILQARHREFLAGEPPICSARPFELLRELVASGITSGEIRPLDPEIATAALFGGPLRMIQLRLDGVLKRPLDDQFDAIWEAAWRAVAA